MKETHPTGNLIPKNFYRVKKLVTKLGLTAKKIDCCVDGCMLFYTDEEMQLKECKFCHKPCFQIQVLVEVNTRRILLRECIIYLSFLDLREYMPP